MYLNQLVNGFLGAALLTFTVSAQATLITFEEFGITNDFTDSGEVTGDEWAASGVLFSTDGYALNIGYTSGSQPNSLGAAANPGNDFDGNLTIQFTGGSSYTDVFFNIFNTPFQASAYAADNTLLTTLTSGTDFDQIFDFSGYAVNRIEISGTEYAIDDLSFDVPEPAVLALFGIGLAGMGFSRRMRKGS